MIEALVRAADAASASGPNWGTAAFGLLCVAISGTNAINPKMQWQMSKWTRKNPAASEPSEYGLRRTRIVNSVLVVVGVGIVIFALTR
ncbi:MAG: DUF6199 family natural product biosynthesis protein [Nakamurella sp.]